MQFLVFHLYLHWFDVWNLPQIGLTPFFHSNAQFKLGVLYMFQIKKKPFHIGRNENEVVRCQSGDQR
jgi:hypothetical protein